MRPLNYSLAIMLMVIPIILGCGSGSKQSSAPDQSQQLVSGLRAELDQARKDLEEQTDLNRDLEDQVRSLTSKLDEIDQQAPATGSQHESPSVSSSGALDSQSRVALMGAKALAEFKAEQLGAKLEKLGKESQAREAELAKALANYESVSSEVSELKKAVQEKTEQLAKMESEKGSQIDQLSGKVQTLTQQVADLKQDVTEKEDLLVTMKKAWSDATQLKTTAENEISRLKTDLETATKQSATFKDTAERSSQEAAFFKGELEQAQERLDSTTAQLEKLTNENLLSSAEIERLKSHSATLANKLYALERAAGVDSENFATSLDRIMSGTFSDAPQRTMAR